MPIHETTFLEGIEVQNKVLASTHDTFYNSSIGNEFFSYFAYNYFEKSIIKIAAK